jgi:hypothetical protein
MDTIVTMVTSSIPTPDKINHPSFTSRASHLYTAVHQSGSARNVCCTAIRKKRDLPFGLSRQRV